MSYECVPLYDSLGEGAVEFIVRHSGQSAAFASAAKLPKLAAALEALAARRGGGGDGKANGEAAGGGGAGACSVKAVIWWGEPGAGVEAALEALRCAGVAALSWREARARGRAAPAPAAPPAPDDLCTIMCERGWSRGGKIRGPGGRCCAPLLGLGPGCWRRPSGSLSLSSSLTNKTRPKHRAQNATTDTSGTTGDPKGVLLKHSAVVAAVAGVVHFCRVREREQGGKRQMEEADIRDDAVRGGGCSRGFAGRRRPAAHIDTAHNNNNNNNNNASTRMYAQQELGVGLSPADSLLSYLPLAHIFDR